MRDIVPLQSLSNWKVGWNELGSFAPKTGEGIELSSGVRFSYDNFERGLMSPCRYNIFNYW
jgi:hypothetical protein